MRPLVCMARERKKTGLVSTSIADDLPIKSGGRKSYTPSSSLSSPLFPRCFGGSVRRYCYDGFIDNHLIHPHTPALFWPRGPLSARALHLPLFLPSPLSPHIGADVLRYPPSTYPSCFFDGFANPFPHPFASLFGIWISIPPFFITTRFPMFSGLASFLPSWPGAGRSSAGSVAIDLERGNGSQASIDDGGLSSISSFRVAGSYTSSIADRALSDLPQDELDNDNDFSTSGCSADLSPEGSASATAPGFLSIGRCASTPPDLRGQDHIYSSTSSSPAPPNHSYARFFHRTRAPKRTRSTRSLGPGGIHGGLRILSPIYEPPNRDSTQKEGETSGPPMPQKAQAPSIHSTTSTIQERIMSLQGMQMKIWSIRVRAEFCPTFARCPSILQSSTFVCANET